MLSRIRGRLTYTNVAVTVALVFAMSGGAYAAGKYVISSTKQISPRVFKQLQGKNGKNGANGVNGVSGANGKDGAPGATGEKGVPGTNGKDGVSVASKELTSKDAACKKEGGSEFTAAEGKKTTACNGSPWTAGGTLPSGASEKGDWAVSGVTVTDAELEAAAVESAVSFTVPLAEAPEIHMIGPKATPPTGCGGTVSEPEAEPGNLCIFIFTESAGFAGPLASGSGAPLKADPTGFIMFATTTNPGEAAIARGTWAVTAK